MKFTKMHGAGNDYIYFDCTGDFQISDPEALSIRLSERHFGIGSDGIVMILPSNVADFRMRIFNADGSEAKMCGNGTRCVGKYVHDKGLTDKTDFTLETLGGIKILHLEVEDGITKSVTVNMGKADFTAANVPVITDRETIIKSPLVFNGKEEICTCLSVGNPHCVIFTNEVASLNLEAIGPCHENAPFFPERINTEFVRVISDTELEMRVWERGSGETLACGTGTCASVAAAAEAGYVKKDEFVLVHLRGGDISVKYDSDGSLTMKGDAEFVFDGELYE
ncbi:MAG: diaminopimelate epimerase [Ruminococcaceae bacterium]|nr:diaminopimelate epimerase [Oscillospiraceae bacterium]